MNDNLDKKEIPLFLTKEMNIKTKANKNIIYYIKSKDSLDLIATKYGSTTKKIMEANGIKNPNHIQIGQLIKIPT